jgi:hypothetical protein
MPEGLGFEVKRDIFMRSLPGPVLDLVELPIVDSLEAFVGQARFPARMIVDSPIRRVHSPEKAFLEDYSGAACETAKHCIGRTDITTIIDDHLALMPRVLKKSSKKQLFSLGEQRCHSGVNSSVSSCYIPRFSRSNGDHALPRCGLAVGPAQRAEMQCNQLLDCHLLGIGL